MSPERTISSHESAICSKMLGFKVGIKMPKKLTLDCDKVELAYKETGNLHKAAAILGISREALMQFMDRNNLPRERRSKFFIDKETLQAIYSDLKSTRLIAQKFSISRETVKEFCKLYNIELEANQPSERLLPEIVRLTNEGKDSFEIADFLDMTAGYINEVARENGIKLNRRFHRGYIITHNGYKKVREVENPDADSKGYVHEHRKIVAEKHGLTALDKTKVCHHIDGNKLNNHPDNLAVMTLADHTSLHHKATA
jgi:DNA-binding CsgD family transcriptional regulator